MTTERKPVNAHDVWKQSGTFALMTSHSSGGYDSGTVIDASGLKRSVHWYLMPKFGTRFTKDLRDGEKHAGLGEYHIGHKPFYTFSEAADFAEGQLGITGWRWNSKGIWVADNSKEIPEVCEISISRDFSHGTCGKLADRNGLCKTHANASEKREANTIAWQGKWDARKAADKRDDDNRRAAEDYVARLLAYRITSTVAYDQQGHCHAAVAIQGEKALAIVEELLLLRRELGIPEDEPIGGVG